MKKMLSLVPLFLLISIGLFGSDIAGIVVDRHGNPIMNVNIEVQNLTTGYSRTFITKKYGGFLADNIPAGIYRLKIHRIGYVDTTVVVNLKDEKVLKIKLREKIFRMKPLVIHSDMAKMFKTPVTFSDIKYNKIATRYSTEEIPVVLKMEPGINVYSDDAIGVGYSYLSLRGFDQSRIAVLFNGVPLNDAESNEVFWIDYPDFLENVKEIQIHRGVSSVLNATGAIGGVINIITKDYGGAPMWKLNTSYGSYNTYKQSISYNSGMINNKMAFYSRFSRITSDGYRENSWSKIWSYFIGGKYYYDKGNLTLNIYGGPENVHLAYYGIDRAHLNGEVSGDIYKDRKYNPITYPHAEDVFNQPHYELISNHILNKNVGIKNIVSLYTGSGYYKQYKSNVHLYEYYMPDIICGNDTITRSDIVRKRMVNEYDLFWIPRISVKHTFGELLLSGFVREHYGHHRGDVVWAEHYPDSIGPDWTYYDYNAKKEQFKFTISENMKPTKKISILTALEGEYSNLKYYGDTIKTQVKFSVPVYAINPKIGINYNFSDFVGLYTSFGMSSRMPGLDNYYDADHPYWSYPLFKDTLNFKEPYIKPEHLKDYELGLNIKYGNLIESKIDIYYMDFNNELVYNGQLDDNGVPIVGNAKRSFHSGIEFSNKFNFSKNFGMIFNGSYNYNKLVDYMSYTMDWNTYTVDSVDLSGNRPGGSPEFIVFGALNYRIKGFELEISDRFVGKQFLDNSMTDSLSISPYNVIGANLNYTAHNIGPFNKIVLSFNANNIFNKLTAVGGYVDNGTPYFFPNAPRNFNLNLKIYL